MNNTYKYHETKWEIHVASKIATNQHTIINQYIYVDRPPQISFLSTAQDEITEYAPVPIILVDEEDMVKCHFYNT